jgi:GntR family transcriptional regulator of vanillate catabolism
MLIEKALLSAINMLHVSLCIMSRTTKALITLRELILNGELSPGEQLREVALVEQIGVSRTPIRAALVRLAEEGLLQKMSGGSYVVREFKVRDIQDAIELRGALEGMAVRLAAERGVSSLSLLELKDCLAQIDDVLAKKDLVNDDIVERYFELNEYYHTQLVALAESFVIERTLDHIVTLPFASPNAFVMAQSELDQSWMLFFVAQEQHKVIVEAVENREGSRAEALAREHARLSLATLKTALKTGTALDQVPGFNLVYPSVS